MYKMTNSWATAAAHTFYANSCWLTIVNESSYPLPEVKASDSWCGHITPTSNEVMNHIDVLIHHSNVERSNTWDRDSRNRPSALVLCKITAFNLTYLLCVNVRHINIPVPYVLKECCNPYLFWLHKQSVHHVSDSL